MNKALFPVFALIASLCAVGLVHLGVIPPESLVFGAVFGTLFTESGRVGDWLKWEEDQRYSREAITVLSGQNLKSGAVLGRQLVGAAGAATAFAGSTGNGVMGAITVGTDAKLGTYKLVIVAAAANAGTFEIEDPEGKIVGRGTVGVAFNAAGLQFTLADGATDFVAGDGFDIKVTGGTFKYGAFDPTVTTGFERAIGVLFFAVDATAADTAGVAIVREAIIGDASSLVWGANVTTAQQKTDALIMLDRDRRIVSRQQV